MKQMGAGWIVWFQDGKIRAVTIATQSTTVEGLKEQSRKALHEAGAD